MPGLRSADVASCFLPSLAPPSVPSPIERQSLSMLHILVAEEVEEVGEVEHPGLFLRFVCVCSCRGLWGPEEGVGFL